MDNVLVFLLLPGYLSVHRVKMASENYRKFFTKWPIQLLW